MNEALIRWRKRLSLSQREAAKRLGMSSKGYQELELRRRFDTSKPTKLDLRTRLACAAVEHNLKPISDDDPLPPTKAPKRSKSRAPMHDSREDCPLWLDDFPEPGACLCDNEQAVRDAIARLEDQIPAMVERLRQLYEIKGKDAKTAEGIVRHLFNP